MGSKDIQHRTFFGYGAGKNTIAGTNSVGFGFKSLFSDSSGQYNSAFGNFSLFIRTPQVIITMPFRYRTYNNIGFQGSLNKSVIMMIAFG